MKFRATIRDERGAVWVEDHDVEIDDPEEYMDRMHRGMALLNPREPLRVCIHIQLTPHGTNEHPWVFTKIDRQEDVTFRIYKCSYCGITGKKMRPDGDVIRDGKFGDNEKYEFCPKEGE